MESQKNNTLHIRIYGHSISLKGIKKEHLVLQGTKKERKHKWKRLSWEGKIHYLKTRAKTEKTKN